MATGTYVISFTLTVEHGNEDLPHVEAVKSEIVSWLEGLNASVEDLSVVEEKHHLP
jgi:hypothetical protein